MSNLPYWQYDGIGLAELVQKKEITPEEIVSAAIARLEQLNPEMNAVIHKMYEKARAAAKEEAGEKPFSGVPVLLKDISQEIKGEPTTSGSKALQGYRAKTDSEYVNRLKATGVIFLGITLSLIHIYQVRILHLNPRTPGQGDHLIQRPEIMWPAAKGGAVRGRGGRAGAGMYG